MRVRKHTLAPAIALLAVAGTLIGLWRFTPLVAQQVSRHFTENMLQPHGYRLELDAVRGTLLGELVFRGPRILDERDAGRIVVRADEVRIRLHPGNLLRGRVLVERLALLRPRVAWDSRRPRPGSAPTAGGARGPLPLVSIEELQVVDGTLVDTLSSGRVLEAQHLSARIALQTGGKLARLTLMQASARLPADSLRLDDLTGSFLWKADTLLVTDLSLRTSASFVTGQGRVIPATHSGWLQGSVSPLDLAEVARVAGRLRPTTSPETKGALPAGLSGKLQGPVQVRWEGQQVQLGATITGNYGAYQLREIETDLLWNPPRLAVRRAAGKVNDCPLELHLESAGGSLQGSVRLDGVDLRLLLPSLAAQLPPSSLRGEVALHRRSSADSLRAQVELQQSHWRGVEVQRLSIRLAHLGETTSLRGGVLECALGGARFSGEMRGAQLDGQFEIDVPRVASAVAAAGLPRGPDGDVRAHGTLRGPRDDLTVEAEGRFGALSYGAGAARLGEFSLWVRHLGSHAELEVSASAETLLARGHTLRALSAELAYSGGVLRIQRSQASAGDTLLAAAASVRQVDLDWLGQRRRCTLVELETALAQLGDQEIRVEDRASIWLSGRAVHVDSLRVATRVGSLRLDGSLDLDARSIDARTEVEGFDLGFLHQFFKTRAQVAGTASGWLEAHGSLDRTRLAARLDAQDGKWNTLSFDTLQVVIQSDASATSISALRLTTPHGVLHGNLRLGYLPAVERWVEAARGSRSPHEFDAADLTGVFSLTGLDVAEIARARSSDAAPLPVSARVSCDLTLGGTVAAPKLEANGEARDIRWAKGSLGSVRFAARFENERLELSEAEIDNGGQKLRASGSLPVRVDLAKGLQVLRDAPFEAHVELPRSTFELATRFVPTLVPPPGKQPGELELKLDLSGSVGAPHTSGTLAVYDASFMLRNMEELYQHVSASAVFEGTTLRFTELHGQSGEKGKISGADDPAARSFCRIVLEPWRLKEFAFDFDVDRVPFNSVPQMDAHVTGQVHIKAAPSRGPLPIPNITGELQVVDAVMRQEFSSNSDQQQLIESTETPDWLCNVNLHAPNGNVWIRNSQAEAELQGSIQIVRDQSGLDFNGLVTIERGDYSLYFDRFKIKPGGTLDFTPYFGFNAELNIDAERGRAGDKTYVHLEGSSTAPRYSLSNDKGDSPDVIQQELLGLANSETGGPQERIIRATATYLDRTIADLTQLHVTIDPLDPVKNKDQKDNRTNTTFAADVSAGRALSDRVYVTYTQRLGSDLHQKVAVELGINRRLLLESSYERGNTKPGLTDVQDAFDVYLKYRREY